MYSISSMDPLAATAFSGLLGHLAFNRLEPRMPLVIMFFLFGVPALPSLAFMSHYGSLWLSIYISYPIYLLSLSTSLILYRISPLHPLSKYPGPIIAKISKFWIVWKIIQGKRHIYYKGLHEKYGTCVRTGPNELSILEADAIMPLFGTNGFHRGSFYDGTKGMTVGENIGSRDPEVHAQRRRLWNRGFTTTALKEYEEGMMRRTKQLVASLASTKPVDLAAWISYYTFDFTGDLAFGGGFEMMEHGGDTEGLWEILDKGMFAAALLGAVPWVPRFLTLLPMSQEVLKLFKLAETQINIRRNADVRGRDVLHYLLDEEMLGGCQLTEVDLISECIALIVGGSDTSSSVMSNLLYYILSHPEYFRKLQAEIDSTFPEGDELTDMAKLVSMTFLNAVINETLRLQPAVLNGLQRCPPPGGSGKVVTGRMIPEGTSVNIPMYSLHRDPRYFWPLPDTFWPERWLIADQELGYSDDSKSQKFIHDRQAFIPFSFGPTVCVGKQLAYLEMRLVITMLVQKFNMRFADGYDPKQWEEDLMDRHVCVKGRLPVVLTPRF